MTPVTDTPTFLGTEWYSPVYRSFDVIGRINMTQATRKTSEPGFTLTTLWEDLTA
ncbi:MAG: hypothetical protein WC379_18640 [Methanoregula sp.]